MQRSQEVGGLEVEVEEAAEQALEASASMYQVAAAEAAWVAGTAVLPDLERRELDPAAVAVVDLGAVALEMAGWERADKRDTASIKIIVPRKPETARIQFSTFRLIVSLVRWIE